MLTQPASCAVRRAPTTSPAAISTKNTPVTRKNRPRLSRTPPKYRPTPSPIAAAMPAAPPSRANHRFPCDVSAAASRNTDVSKPSLRTARNAIAASASAPPRWTARPASRSSSPLSCAALPFIQMIIDVTNTTAMALMTVSIISCWTCGRLAANRSRPTPTATLSTTAEATPANIGRIDWPLRLRKAATMLTMSEASRPSRRPMRNVPMNTPNTPCMRPVSVPPICGLA